VVCLFEGHHGWLRAGFQQWKAGQQCEQCARRGLAQDGTRICGVSAERFVQSKYIRLVSHMASIGMQMRLKLSLE